MCEISFWERKFKNEPRHSEFDKIVLKTLLEEAPCLITRELVNSLETSHMIRLLNKPGKN